MLALYILESRLMCRALVLKMKRAHKLGRSFLAIDLVFIFREYVVVITGMELYLEKLYALDLGYGKKVKITVLRR